LSSFGRNLSYNFGGSIRKPKELRKADRRKVGIKAWIRLDGGFAVRPCNLADLSDTGVQITIPAAEVVPGIFTLLMSRNASSGRRARIMAARIKYRCGVFIEAPAGGPKSFQMDGIGIRLVALPKRNVLLRRGQ
jgi:hypothetical protein